MTKIAQTSVGDFLDRLECIRKSSTDIQVNQQLVNKRMLEWIRKRDGSLSHLYDMGLLSGMSDDPVDSFKQYIYDSFYTDNEALSLFLQPSGCLADARGLALAYARACPSDIPDTQKIELDSEDYKILGYMRDYLSAEDSLSDICSYYSLKKSTPHTFSADFFRTNSCRALMFPRVSERRFLVGQNFLSSQLYERASDCSAFGGPSGRVYYPCLFDLLPLMYQFIRSYVQEECPNISVSDTQGVFVTGLTREDESSYFDVILRGDVFLDGPLGLAFDRLFSRGDSSVYVKALSKFMTADSSLLYAPFVQDVILPLKTDGFSAPDILTMPDFLAWYQKEVAGGVVNQDGSLFLNGYTGFSLCFMSERPFDWAKAHVRDNETITVGAYLYNTQTANELSIYDLMSGYSGEYYGISCDVKTGSDVAVLPGRELVGIKPKKRLNKLSVPMFYLHLENGSLKLYPEGVCQRITDLLINGEAVKPLIADNFTDPASSSPYTVTNDDMSLYLKGESDVSFRKNTLPRLVLKELLNTNNGALYHMPIEHLSDYKTMLADMVWAYINAKCGSSTDYQRPCTITDTEFILACWDVFGILQMLNILSSGNN